MERLLPIKPEKIRDAAQRLYIARVEPFAGFFRRNPLVPEAEGTLKDMASVMVAESLSFDDIAAVVERYEEISKAKFELSYSPGRLKEFLGNASRGAAILLSRFVYGLGNRLFTIQAFAFERVLGTIRRLDEEVYFELTKTISDYELTRRADRITELRDVWIRKNIEGNAIKSFGFTIDVDQLIFPTDEESPPSEVPYTIDVTFSADEVFTMRVNQIKDDENSLAQLPYFEMTLDLRSEGVRMRTGDRRLRGNEWINVSEEESLVQIGSLDSRVLYKMLGTVYDQIGVLESVWQIPRSTIERVFGVFSEKLFED